MLQSIDFLMLSQHAREEPVRPCPLCEDVGGVLVHRTDLLRVVRAEDTPAHPAFYRVIWNAHVSEFSALPDNQRAALMDAVVQVERVLLAHLAPVKINLASLGNVVPHLHWHVIARFADDAQFPAPIWAPPVRERDTQNLCAQLPALDAALRQALGQSAPPIARLPL
jgi:diadenosine tetraphosphate (Ap4A) HIT family hydrolase